MGVSPSIRHLERRAVLLPRATVIVDAYRGDVHVAKPLLYLGDVGLMIERIGRRRRAQRMRADLEPELRRVGRQVHISDHQEAWKQHREAG